MYIFTIKTTQSLYGHIQNYQRLLGCKNRVREIRVPGTGIKYFGRIFYKKKKKKKSLKTQHCVFALKLF